jgi:hypothetical protein
MKKLILYALVGAFAMLLAQSPVIVQAMDDGGSIEYNGYRGYGMGPGMMHYGGGTDYGMAPQCNDYVPSYHQNQTYLDKKGAEKVFEDYLNARHNPNLKLGEIKDEGSSFEAELLTQNNSLVDKLIVDKNSGQMRSAY